MRDRALHRAVDRLAGIAAHALDRVEVDDRAAAAVDHRLEERARHREEVPQVDLVHRVPRLGRRLREPHERPEVADVVDEHVDAAVVRARDRVGERRDLVVVAHVDDVGASRCCRRPRSRPAWPRARSGSISAISTIGAVLGEQPGDGAADAVTASGHDGDLAVEQALVVGDRGDVGGFLGHVRTLSNAFPHRRRAGRLAMRVEECEERHGRRRDAPA